MSIGVIIAVFLLGVIAGAVGIMVVSCLVVDGMKRKKELTKEEWKMGIRPADYNSVSPLPIAIATVVLGLIFYIVIALDV